MNFALSKTDGQIISVTLKITALVALLAVMVLARKLVLGSLVGIGFGVILSPLVNRMYDRLRIPRGLGALIVALFILLLVGGIGYGLYVLLADQVNAFVANAPGIFERVSALVREHVQRYPWLRSTFEDVDLKGAGLTTLAAFFTGLKFSISAIGGFFLIFTLAIYTAVNARPYFDGLVKAFPAYRRRKAAHVMSESGKVLRQWFRGQLIITAITATITTVSLWILGIDYWLLLGVLTGLLGFIPYIGSFITLVVTGLVTLGSEPDKILWVVGIYLAIQQIEGDVTIPLVMKGHVHLPEVHLIILMLIMGYAFGLLGVFAAPAVMAVARTIYLLTYVPAMDAQQTRPPKPRAMPLAEPVET